MPSLRASLQHPVAQRASALLGPPPQPRSSGAMRAIGALVSPRDSPDGGAARGSLSTFLKRRSNESSPAVTRSVIGRSKSSVVRSGSRSPAAPRRSVSLDAVLLPSPPPHLTKPPTKSAERRSRPQPKERGSRALGRTSSAVLMEKMRTFSPNFHASVSSSARSELIEEGTEEGTEEDDVSSGDSGDPRVSDASATPSTASNRHALEMQPLGAQGVNGAARGSVASSASSSGVDAVAMSTPARSAAEAEERGRKSMTSVLRRREEFAVADASTQRVNRKTGVDNQARFIAVVMQGECSFMYRYISRESCSQFDSLPLTSLTDMACGGDASDGREESGEAGVVDESLYLRRRVDAADVLGPLHLCAAVLHGRSDADRDCVHAAPRLPRRALQLRLLGLSG